MADRGGEPQFVFGYASLIHDFAHGFTRSPDPRGYVTDLRGARRVWGVAMDNRETIAGYKYFEERGGGGRPPVFVAFLDVLDAKEPASVNGVCLPVTGESLEAIDARERNYERVEVTARIAEPLGRTWAYTGSPAGRERLARGVESGRAVVADSYADSVLGGFARLGDAELERFRSSTASAPGPVLRLDRVDIPAAV